MTTPLPRHLRRAAPYLLAAGQSMILLYAKRAAGRSGRAGLGAAVLAAAIGAAVAQGSPPNGDPAT